MNETIKQIKFLPEDKTYDIQANATRKATSETGSRVVTFTDGASAPLVKCDVAITGSQDLHGYDKPWVGGAGKNRIEMIVDDIKSINSGSGTWSGNSYTIEGITFTILTDSANNVIGIKVNGTATAEIIFFLDNYSVQPSGTYTYSGHAENNQNIRLRFRDSNGFFALSNSTLTVTRETESYGISKTIVVPSGAVASNLVFTPMICLSTASNPTTFAPYSNICPITAYTENTIWVGGDNHYNEATTTEGIYISSTGVETPNVVAKSSDYIAVTSDEFTLGYNSDVGGTQNCRVHGYDKNKNWVQQIALIVSTTVSRYSQSFSIPDGIAYIRFAIHKDNYAIMLNEGSTPLRYEPYNPNSTTHTTTYPSAIYRGSEDVVKGEVETEKKKIVFDGTETWYGLGNSVFKIFITDMLCPTNDIICSHYETTTYSQASSSMPNGTIKTHNNNTEASIYIKDTRFTELADFKAAIVGVELAYPLATPTTSSVTPTNLPIKSLSGYTHIESSTGDMEVEYITQEFQPIVDLIESNKHVYSTAEQIVGTWIDGSTLYEKSYHVPTLTSTYIIIDSTISASTIKLRNVSMGSIVIGGAYNNAQYVGGHLSYNTFIRVILNVGLSVGMEDPPAEPITDFDFTIRYTKTTPTRSLNLTKSAVTEIPDEIKNAEYEEKPETNEADDDAPTEVDER